MPPLLLSLPDELLAHVVDEALGEYAPRYYKQRQDTARALCLVNKRIGAIAQGKIVEAVHFVWQYGEDEPSPACSCDIHSKVRQVRVEYSSHVTLALQLPTSFLPPFHALRDLRLVQVCGVQLEQTAQLPELRDLVLSWGGYSASAPLVAPKLARLTLFFCEEDLNVAESRCLLDSVGCPSLRYLYLGRRNVNAFKLCTSDLVEQLDHLALEFFDDQEVSDTWTRMNLDGATFEKALFDCIWYELDLLAEDTQGPRHIRFYDLDDPGEQRPIRYSADYLPTLASRLLTVFPDLCTLYLPRAFDVACVARDRQTIDDVRNLATTCSAASVQVVFEHDDEDLAAGELRESPHFAERCRRVRGGRAAAGMGAGRAVGGSG